MIKELVNRWYEKKSSVEASFKETHPTGYEDIVNTVVTAIQGEDDYKEISLDPERIERIDWGDYQGTLLFVIGAKGYQPSVFYGVSVGYGSCSGCDTFESIREYDSGKPSDQQVDGYMTLALHIVQGIKRFGED